MHREFRIKGVRIVFVAFSKCCTDRLTVWAGLHVVHLRLRWPFVIYYKLPF